MKMMGWWWYFGEGEGFGGLLEFVVDLMELKEEGDEGRKM